jgi:hypothetical protein
MYFRFNIRIRSEMTRDHYRRSIREFSNLLGRPATLLDLIDDNMALMQRDALDRGYREVTANQQTKSLRALWNWCAKRRLVEQFPTFYDLIEPELDPICWSQEELHLLFTGCARQTGWIGPHHASTWWLAIHWWWFATAERTEATMLLRRDMIDMSTRIARVPAAIRKGGRKNQIYKLPERLCELLDVMFRTETRTGLVFEHQWKDWRSIYHRYRDLLKDCGLKHVRCKTGPKKMRITVLTLIESAGGDASAFARHSNKGVTEHYLDRAVIFALKAGVWPPEDFKPEDNPKNFRNLWGLVR